MSAKGGFQPDARQDDLDGGRPGNHRSTSAKPLSRARGRACVEHVRPELKVSERRICLVLLQYGSTQRLVPIGRGDEEKAPRLCA